MGGKYGYLGVGGGLPDSAVRSRAVWEGRDWRTNQARWAEDDRAGGVSRAASGRDAGVCLVETERWKHDGVPKKGPRVS